MIGGGVERRPRQGDAAAVALGGGIRGPWSGASWSSSWWHGALMTVWDSTWVSTALLVLVPIIVPVGFMFHCQAKPARAAQRARPQGQLREGGTRASRSASASVVSPVGTAARRPGRHRAAAARRRPGGGRTVRAAAPHAARLPVRAVAAVGVDATARQSECRRQGGPAARPVRLPHRRVPVPVGHREPVARLPRAGTGQPTATTTAEELARFVSRFTAITCGADILFLVLLGGAAAAALRAPLRPRGELVRRPGPSSSPRSTAIGAGREPVPRSPSCSSWRHT